METTSASATCNICDSTDHRVITDESQWSVLKCYRCGLVFVYPIPAMDQIFELYPADYYAHGKPIV